MHVEFRKKISRRKYKHNENKRAAALMGGSSFEFTGYLDYLLSLIFSYLAGTFTAVAFM